MRVLSIASSRLGRATFFSVVVAVAAAVPFLPQWAGATLAGGVAAILTKGLLEVATGSDSHRRSLGRIQQAVERADAAVAQVTASTEQATRKSAELADRLASRISDLESNLSKARGDLSISAAARKELREADKRLSSNLGGIKTSLGETEIKLDRSWRRLDRLEALTAQLMSVRSENRKPDKLPSALQLRPEARLAAAIAQLKTDLEDILPDGSPPGNSNR